MAKKKTQVALSNAMVPPQDKEKALALRAILGDDEATVEACTQHGIKITAHQLQTWMKKYPEEFARLRESRLSAIRQDVIKSSRSLLAKRDRIADKALTSLDVDLDDADGLSAKQVTAILRAVDSGRAADINALQKLSTEAVAPAERQSYQDLVLALARSGAVTVESTVTEDEDA